MAELVDGVMAEGSRQNLVREWVRRKEVCYYKRTAETVRSRMMRLRREIRIILGVSSDGWARVNYVQVSFITCTCIDDLRTVAKLSRKT